MNSAHSRYLYRLDFRDGRIDLQHGAGGRLSRQLVDELFACGLHAVEVTL